MAIVSELRPRVLERDSRHTKAGGTYSIVQATDGTELLQIDTYGSKDRRIPGKVSRSIRFSPGALAQLKKILADHFQ